ncbi:MAG TPA: EAL domain-containing protein, partial [Candidatus Limnocylindrales bacterium]|nr:EAL domain-containing protein [Candidatus Limnocylindrales bacterium]
DDFGTGYSSLNYIRQFPVDIVKIDKSFIDGIASEGDGRALVAMIVDLTRALGLGTIAEGIEASDQLNALRSLGCALGQGYLFSRPVGFEEVFALLATSFVAQPAA